MNLFLASAAAQHVVKSACLFKKPHGNSGTQQYTLHFKMPLWVDFYFDSFKMGIKKPWNSQYWRGGALGLCGSRGGAHFTLILHHFRSATVPGLLCFPAASALGAVTTVWRHSSTVILILSLEESVSSTHPFKANPKYLQPILWVWWIFPCSSIFPLYICASSNKNKAIIYLPWLLYHNWIFIPVSYLLHSEPMYIITLQQTWSEMKDSLIYFPFY